MTKRKGAEGSGGWQQAALEFNGGFPNIEPKDGDSESGGPPLSEDVNPGYEDLDRSEAESATGAGIGSRDVVDDTVEANLRRINEGRPKN